MAAVPATYSELASLARTSASRSLQRPSSTSWLAAKTGTAAAGAPMPKRETMRPVSERTTK